jgi:hypothetical protein
MNLLPAGTPFPAVAPGDYYLVDVGELVPVAAVNARSAFHIAMTMREGMAQQCPPEHPVVYQIDPDGELIAVYD